jgi:Homeodomain-like domain
LKNARERMDVLAAYREVGSYRGAAEVCGTTHKTVKRIVERHNSGGAAPERKDRGPNYDEVGALVAERVGRSNGKISLRAGVVANVVVPTADYVRFATHYGFRPDFCEGGDSESKGIVEALVGYAKRDLVVPTEPSVADLPAANAAAAEWCAEVNAAVHSEICAVQAGRLNAERELLGTLPSLLLEIGAKPISRKVDKLSCVRFGSARYSVPNR